MKAHMANTGWLTWRIVKAPEDGVLPALLIAPADVLPRGEVEGDGDGRTDKVVVALLDVEGVNVAFLSAARSAAERHESSVPVPTTMSLDQASSP